MEPTGSSNTGELPDVIARFKTGTVHARSKTRSTGASAPGRAATRTSKYGKWRAATLASVYLIMVIHIVHWRLAGKTLAPLELNEVMYTLEAGIITAGFLLMVTLFLGSAIFGRFFCSWACHILALEDLSSWILRKLHIRPRPVRSRLLLFVPPLALLYMFVWPQIKRLIEGRAAPKLRMLTDEEGWASFVTDDFWRNLPDPWITVLTFLICGFVVVYVLGSRSFCLYGCPYGAAFATVDRIAPGRIMLKGDCRQCGTCTAVCTSHVRVHEEIARFGKVVDTNCMKDLDCIENCPEDAIGFGFTKPALGASFSRTGRRAQRYDFSFGEELLIALVFLAVLFGFRGLYVIMPFLMTLGLAAIVSYAAILCVRLVKKTDVRLNPFRFKREGKLTVSGGVFVTVMVLFSVLFAHSTFIRYHEIRGQRAFDDLRSEMHRVSELSSSVAYRSAVVHLTAAYDHGLLKPFVREHQLAALLLKGDDSSRALPYLQRIVERDPLDVDSQLALAQILANQEQWEDAIAEYRSALAKDPENAAAQMALGEILGGRGELHDAAERFRRVVELRPDSGEAHYNLGVVLASMGDEDGAIQAYREAVALSPDDPEILNNLGHLLARRGDLDDAATHFLRAIELRPDFAHPHFNVAQIYQQRGDIKLAREHFGISARLDTRYAELLQSEAGM